MPPVGIYIPYISGTLGDTGVRWSRRQSKGIDQGGARFELWSHVARVTRWLMAVEVRTPRSFASL